MKNSQVGWQCETHDCYDYYAQFKEKIAKKEIKVISVDPVISQTQNYLGCEHQDVNSSQPSAGARYLNLK
ncbi:trimethylamine-N-oxide reductase [Photobacterium damselae subsp. piscicida]|nr:trimethylamine-N-oxide reductase [Photobacterium damselae subsp. piscicida]